jgi:Pentapeptide repeats (8 copies)
VRPDNRLIDTPQTERERSQNIVRRSRVRDQAWLASEAGPNDTREANLWGAKLDGAVLPGANLREANLQGIDLPYADLRKAGACTFGCVRAAHGTPQKIPAAAAMSPMAAMNAAW